MKIQITKLPKNRYSIGGVLQSHGSDWSDGLVTIGAGGSHEENKYQGVQMGVDSEGTPNLVEEGETIFNDYVYSNRIELDEEAKKAFHVSKKREITYAEMSKKLEKEAAERPNDPLSKAALQKQMEELANHQERQKQEMEAERAEEYFNSLSDEEKVALMQQIAGQQAQEEAMMQEAAAQQQPTQEEMVAAQQQVSPEEAAMMQQQQVQGVSAADAMGAMAQPMMAYGGRVNRFDDGGYKNALSYIKRHHPDLGNKEMIAKVVARLYSPQFAANGMPINSDKDDREYSRIMKSILYGRGNFRRPLPAQSEDTEWGKRKTARNRKHYQELLDLGLSKKVAFGLAFPDSAKLESEKQIRNTLYNELVRGNSSSQQVNQTNAQAEKKANKYRNSKTGEIFDTREAAEASVDAYNKAHGVGKYRASANQAAQTGTAYAAQTATPEESTSSTSASAGNTGTSTTTTTTGGNGNRAARPNTGDIVNYKYDWYRNGSDGYSTPTGFKVGENGRAYDYTDDYTNLVNSLGADDIRAWAAEHPDDLSLASFLARGNRLEDLTDEQWRKGATDGKYGFMHHVANQLLQNSNPDNINNVLSDENKALIDKVMGEPYGPREFHRVEGDDDDLIGPEDTWEGVGKETRREILPNGDVVIYHEPIESVAHGDVEAVVDADNDTAYDVIPVHRSEWPRYAGLFGPAVGLGMQLAGVGRPDYSGLDAALDAYDNRGSSLADYKPIGNYLTYRPMDMWAEQNRMDANSRATDRAILNNAAPIGTQMAGALANAYTSQLGSGQLYRNALEYNDNLRKQVADFNRATDMFNATAYNQASLQNAQIQNHDRALRAQLAMDAARQKMSAEADWYKGIYGNVGGIFQGLSELGKENAQHNMIADMAATGIFGTIKDQPIANGYVKVVPRTNTGKYGGKMKKKKRGLTC